MRHRPLQEPLGGPAPPGCPPARLPVYPGMNRESGGEHMKIIVDAMGGDNAPVSNVRGALAAVRELGVEVILVGRGEDILKVLKEDGIGELPPGLEIVHASEVVEMCDNPATAFKEKKDSSDRGPEPAEERGRGGLCLRGQARGRCCRRPR